MKENYLKLVEEAYQGEVYGEALYHSIADATDDPDRAYKWYALAQMEKETKAYMRMIVARLGGNTIEDEHWRQQGIRDAEEYSSMPWMELMEFYSKELDSVIAEYMALEDDCPIEDAFALRRLTHHEVVTKQFCDLELKGQSDISTRSVLEFCENPPTPG